jgi:hypothetical protein
VKVTVGCGDFDFQVFVFAPHDEVHVRIGRQGADEDVLVHGADLITIEGHDDVAVL